MKKTEKMTSREIVLILDNIRSVLNVGGIFRTADAIGISKIFLVGVTPAPIDRFGRKRSDFHKSALGAEDSVAWEHFSDFNKLISELKGDGFKIIALEQSKNSIDYKKVSEKILDNGRLAIILGNEVSGISRELLNYCDIVAEIPMLGKKESLNVSVSAGIFLFRLFDL